MDTSEEKSYYFIDLNWLEENNRSFAALAQSRMCPSCQKRLGTEEEEQIPVVDSKSGKVVFETHQVRYGSEPFEVISTCCSNSEEFITSHLPLLEIVFRIFLANANEQLTLAQICDHIKQWLSRVGDFRDVSPPMLKRLLDHDRYYGLRPFAWPQS